MLAETEVGDRGPCVRDSHLLRTGGAHRLRGRYRTWSDREMPGREREILLRHDLRGHVCCGSLREVVICARPELLTAGQWGEHPVEPAVGSCGAGFQCCGRNRGRRPSLDDVSARYAVIRVLISDTAFDQTTGGRGTGSQEDIVNFPVPIHTGPVEANLHVWFASCLRQGRYELPNLCSQVIASPYGSPGLATICGDIDAAGGDWRAAGGA